MVFDVGLGSLRRMVVGMLMVAVRQMGVVGRFFMVPGLVMVGSLAMMARGVFVVLGCFEVVIGCLFRHG